MRVRSARLAAGAVPTLLSLLATASVMAASPASEAGADTTAQPLAPVPTAPAPTGLWSETALNQLRFEVSAAAGEGLDPSNYDIASLDAVQRQGIGNATDREARRIALALAHDYANGRVTDKGRFDWHIETDEDLNGLAGALDAAVREDRVRPWLRSLLPTDPRYAALRAAYAVTPEANSAIRDRLRANLERWRWMPRSLGEDHIFVNVPSYTLAVIEGGRAVSSYTVVVGKPQTPTPQISAEVRTIVVNPWWNVPPSIASHMHRGRKGFVTAAGGGLRQPPGPRNALGKVKIDMPNPHSIYLHDTPSKALFAESSRAFSHGCIRVKDVDKLATELARHDDGSDQAVRRALAGSATRTVALHEPRPVYLVYFTADVGADGRIVT